MFKVNNKDTKCQPDVFTVDFTHISKLFLLFLLLNLNKQLFARIFSEIFSRRFVIPQTMAYVRAIARACAITRANQEKGGFGGR